MLKNQGGDQEKSKMRKVIRAGFDPGTSLVLNPPPNPLSYDGMMLTESKIQP